MSLALMTVGCAQTAADPACDPATFRAVRTARVDRAEVTLCGTVTRVGRLRRSRAGVHRQFVVDSGSGGPVEIDANVDIMGNFPIRQGERAVVRGEYYVDTSGRDGVHWTHRTDRGNHPAGYVTLDGITYR